MSAFTLVLAAGPEDIDQLGHVNNAVWVKWIEKVSIAHWEAVATREQIANYYWVIIRHEIDYLRALRNGESVMARTWIEPGSRGARSTRSMEFVGESGTIHVRARTDWAMIDRATNRPARVRAEMLAPFVDPSD